MTASPEAIAGKWAELEALANRIGDAGTRERYLSDWRGRFDAEFPPWLRDSEIVSLPDWKHVGEISARERRQAGLVSDAFLSGLSLTLLEADAARRVAWDVGRRVAAGLIERSLAESALREAGASSSASDRPI